MVTEVMMKKFRLATALLSGLMAIGLTACNTAPKDAKPLGKWGYMDKEGNFIILPQFDAASEFNEDGAVILQGKNRIRLVGNPPKEGGPPLKDEDLPVLPPLPDLEAIKIDHGKYAIKEEGDIIFDPTSKEKPPEIFTNGLTCAKVSNGSGYIYINKKGELAIPITFPEARPFSQGWAAVKQSGQWGFINKKGDFVVPPKFMNAGSMYKGLAPVQVKSDQTSP